jgi:GT2 family glycosyltransferase
VGTVLRRMRVAAGVLHYRFWPDVRATLDGLLAQTRPADELFVLDHASGDRSADRIREAYPDLEVINAPVNRGPIAGLNQLLQELLRRETEAIFMVTHGSRFAPDALEHLAAHLESRPDLGAVGPILAFRDDPERLYFGGGYIDRRTWHMELRDYPRALPEWRGQPPQDVDWLDSGSVLMRSEAARQAGYLREELYYHYDDPEYGMRLRSLGWKAQVVPAAVGWVTPGLRSPYIESRNRLGFVAWSAPRRVLARELVRVIYVVLRGYLRPRHSWDREEAWPRLRGLLDFCRGRWGPPPASLTGGRHG